jgi:uncharacterized protein (DUF1697 family)
VLPREGILTQLGQPVRCLVRDLSEVDAVIDANPLPEAENDGSRFIAVVTQAGRREGFSTFRRPGGWSR